MANRSRPGRKRATCPQPWRGPNCAPRAPGSRGWRGDPPASCATERVQGRGSARSPPPCRARRKRRACCRPEPPRRDERMAGTVRLRTRPDGQGPNARPVGMAHVQARRISVAQAAGSLPRGKVSPLRTFLGGRAEPAHHARRGKGGAGGAIRLVSGTAEAHRIRARSRSASPSSAISARTSARAASIAFQLLRLDRATVTRMSRSASAIAVSLRIDRGPTARQRSPRRRCRWMRPRRRRSAGTRRAGRPTFAPRALCSAARRRRVFRSVRGHVGNVQWRLFDELEPTFRQLIANGERWIIPRRALAGPEPQRSTSAKAAETIDGDGAGRCIALPSGTRRDRHQREGCISCPSRPKHGECSLNGHHLSATCHRAGRGASVFA